jgi:hypothetical protein
MGAPSTRPRPSSGRLHEEATLARSPRQADRIAGAFNARIAWHLILTHAFQSTRPKWPQSLCPSTDWPDRKTVPAALLRLMRHPPGWDWQQPSPASGAIGISASPDPRARTRPRLGRRSPPRPTPGLGLDLASDDDLRLARPQGSDSASTSEESPPRSGRPCHKGRPSLPYP